MTTKRSAFALAVFAFIFELAVNGFGQKVGGFTAISTEDAGVQAAAEFAVTTQAGKANKEMSLSEIIKAERQVVAGTNFRLCMEVSSEAGEGQDDVMIYVIAVVYVDPKGNKKLSSWAISECGGE